VVWGTVVGCFRRRRADERRLSGGHHACDRRREDSFEPRVLVTLFTVDGVEWIWVLAAIIVLLYLWSQRSATLADVIIGLYIWVSGFF
jgi:hypothetical protein